MSPRDSTVAPLQVRSIDAAGLDPLIGPLSELLRDCVADGASLGFVLPFGAAEAARFWRDMVHPALTGPHRRLWVAESQGALAGAVQLDCAVMPNQPHRAEVMKLMVRPEHRRRGVARALMASLEAEARIRGRWLLTLDTASPLTAEPLYRSLGYERIGAIPAYALHPIEDRYDATVFMYKRLDRAAPLLG